ncbi:MAG TPA: hypothetical protein VF810_01390 [Patescibacteria group bacterium]
MKLKREARLQKVYDEALSTILPLTKKELFLAGLFLYWGEGGKTHKGLVSISNTDPAVLQFTLCWMQYTLDIPKEKVTVRLHLYEDMVVEEEIRFWRQTLSLPEKQFAKPYIKKSKRADLDEKGYGHGTCNLIVGNTIIKEKILMSIKAIADFYSQRVSLMV